MLGLSPREARRRFDAVIEFAELQEFVDLKIKNYSSGMLVRLAFAVMIQVDAEILLIDEVLAVGDASFQQKCFDEFERIHAAGKTVLLVTHDMGSVRRFCTRAMLLERGRVAAMGDPEAVGTKYLELNFSDEARAAEAAEAGAGPRVVSRPEKPERFGTGAAEVLDAWFEDETNQRTSVLKSGYHCTFTAHVVFHERVEQPRFSVTLQNNHRVIVFTASTEWKTPKTGIFDPGDSAYFRVFFANLLGPDRYLVNATLEQPGGGWIDHRERLFSIIVTGTLNTGAIVQLPYDLNVYPVRAGQAADAPA
jgi:energy-coupling factor transporter ATP-binding protein EcfA2